MVFAYYVSGIVYVFINLPFLRSGSKFPYLTVNQNSPFEMLDKQIFLASHSQVLEGVIKYRWNALPVEQRDGMKNYISEVIVQVTFGGLRLFSG